MATLYPPAPEIANGREYVEQAAAYQARNDYDRTWSRNLRPSIRSEMDFAQMSLGWSRVRGCTHRRYLPASEHTLDLGGA